jgi:hypothetical protein
MLPVYNSCWKKKKSSPNISWNEKEELKYKGETVPGSNVVDLVNDVLSKRKYFNPQGWKHSEKPYEKQMFHKIWLVTRTAGDTSLRPKEHRDLETTTESIPY